MRRLADLGYEVTWVRRSFPGATDRSLVEIAREAALVIVTRDKGFGELVFRFERSVPVILLRLDESTPAAELIDFTVRVIESRDDWSRYFSVVESDRVRTIPLHT